VHAALGEIPTVRLLQEREHLQPLAPPWPGQIARLRPVTARLAALPNGYQHPLRIYEELIGPARP